MRSAHSLDRLGVAFDDDRLVADAGLLLPAHPAHRRTALRVLLAGKGRVRRLGHGRADKVDLFASMSDCGGEPTGIYVGQDPFTLYLNVQHAADGNDKAMLITRD